MVKIKNITDVVTNSSSEVFILQKDDAINLEKDYPFIYISELTLEIIEENSWYSDIYSQAANLIDERVPLLDENEDIDKWRKVVERYKKAFETLADEYMEVEIETCYKNWEDATDEAKRNTISSKNCH